jgi:hypothetical protein
MSSRLGNILNAIRAKNLEPRIKELALRMACSRADPVMMTTR